MLSATPNYKLKDITIEDIYKTLQTVLKEDDKGLETSTIFELNIMFNDSNLRNHFQKLKEQNLKKLKQYTIYEVEYNEEAKFYKKVNDWFNRARKMGHSYFIINEKL